MNRPQSTGMAGMRRMLTLARDLLQAADLRSVLALVGPALQELLAADGAFLLVNLGGQEYMTAFDRQGGLLPAREESPLCRLARQALEEDDTILLPTGEDGEEEAGSLVAFPFPPVKPVGVLAACWHRQLNARQLESLVPILRHVSELAGAALGNVDFRLVLEEEISARTQQAEDATRERVEEMQKRDFRDEESRHVSVTDVLTGMLSRRGFFLHAEQGLKVARRQKLAATLIFADIDGLAEVNERLGHEAGDRLIQDGARIFREAFRDSDVTARLGGGQFAAFALDGAKPAAILARIEERLENFRRHALRPYQIAFSTGVVPCDPASAMSLADYLAQADRLYAGKKGPAH